MAPSIDLDTQREEGVTRRNGALFAAILGTKRRSEAAVATGIRTTLTRRQVAIAAAVVVTIVLALVLGISIPLARNNSNNSSNSGGTKSAASLTLLVGIDGFLMDYISETDTPNIYAFFQSSAVSSMQPVFPAQSFPNQYSMVSGLLPVNHGIVGDYFHSTQINAQYFWQSIQAAGYASGTVGWPGSEAGINSISPTYQYAFNTSQSDSYRAHVVANWTKGLGAGGEAIVTPLFIATHFRAMDVSGTAVGPTGSTIKPNLSSVDSAFQIIVDAVKSYSGTCNVIAVSDHGMAAVNNSVVLYYEDLFDITSATVVQNRPMAYLYTSSSFNMSAFQANLANFAGTLTAYVKGVNDAPGFQGGGDRVPDILLLPAEGVVLAYRTLGNPHAPVSAGSAGYLNTLASMQAVFAGYGPAFVAKGTATSSTVIRTVDVYALLAKIVGNGVVAASGVDSSIDGFEGLLA
ncbi:hypothetical protein HDU82_001778 [Entophlyctis luteolus]|nr:hypothetical protein HDU82_001778 [Entophlyctis luteolus]